MSCDGRGLFAGRAWLVLVAGTGVFGGGSRIGSLDPADGLLDVAVVEARSRARLALHVYGLRTGRALGQHGVRAARGASVEVAVADGTAFNVDGEVVPAGPAMFRAERRAFRLVAG